MKLIVKAAFALSLMALSSEAMAAQAGGFNPDNLFFGGGLSINDVSGSDEGTGYQFFGGYEFGAVAQNINLDAEVGYMNTGDMNIGPVSVKAKGLWTTGVARLAVSPELELVARAGWDFGDDDGFMLGVGGGYIFNKQSTLRLELVERDDVSSLQLNFIFRP